jgi:hypothetical protein
VVQTIGAGKNPYGAWSDGTVLVANLDANKVSEVSIQAVTTVGA